MPKWNPRPKKSRSTLQKAHIITLAARRRVTEHQIVCERGVDSYVAGAMEKLLAALKREKYYTMQLKKQVKKIKQRERRTKSKVTKNTRNT
jgi:hypothetical protein